MAQKRGFTAGKVSIFFNFHVQDSCTSSWFLLLSWGYCIECFWIKWVFLEELQDFFKMISLFLDNLGNCYVNFWLIEWLLINVQVGESFCFVFIFFFHFLFGFNYSFLWKFVWLVSLHCDSNTLLVELGDASIWICLFFQLLLMQVFEFAFFFPSF